MRRYGPPFQVGIETWFRVFRSVPTPALPGANSHWISGESRGGEREHTQGERDCAVLKTPLNQESQLFLFLKKKKKCTSRNKKKSFNVMQNEALSKQEHQELWKCWKRGRVTTTTPAVYLSGACTRPVEAKTQQSSELRRLIFTIPTKAWY